MISRRAFIGQLAGAAAGVSVLNPLAWGSEASSDEVAGKEGMIVRSRRFLDLEMPTEFFNSWITPVPHFFVRNHMHEPSMLDAKEWRLTVGGEVRDTRCDQHAGVRG